MKKQTLAYQVLSGLFIFAGFAQAQTARPTTTTTFAPAWSTISLADAKAQCARPSADATLTRKLGAGRPVGYPLLAELDSDWTFIVACERTGFDGEPTYGPAWTSQSFGEARKLCEAPSDTSSLAAGTAVGESVLAPIGRTEAFVVICERPVLDAKPNQSKQ